MNNTDKAKMEAAKRMLLGRIDIEEVAMLLDMSMEQLMPLKEELEDKIRETYGDVDINDIQNGTVIFDNYDDFGANEDLPQDNKE
ncbi:MAG: hypothetical protein Q4D51_04710 [Eubacteriales bacterium]|nr:hypothetical protein [Eubacteriales bacterium]